MSKTVFIAEKPSVAQQFADALKLKTKKHNGYLESENTIVTWCYGHLVTMSYPDVYDEKYKKWAFATLPFLPEKYLYEVVASAKDQFNVVKGLLTREDVDTIYVCTDSGREGEYIYRLVEMQANVTGKTRKRVWIDSQTEEEIIKGIKNAKDLAEYDNLSDAAYMRAIEDYLMGINFSRALSLKYSQSIKDFLGIDRAVIAVGRVMTCVLGMVVKREREIREFVKTPFYRINANMLLSEDSKPIPAEFKVVEGSDYFESPLLYNEKGFKRKEDADALINSLPNEAILDNKEKKTELKNPPLLYNLADLQNDCSRIFKISPDQTLEAIQTLYERKLVTYPRTDARVLSTAVAKEIYKNINGLRRYSVCSQFADEIIAKEMYKDIASKKNKYVNDKAITDHYAVIPTGQGLEALNSVNETYRKIYELIVRRFLSIFYPAAKYDKLSLTFKIKNESFFSNFKVLKDEGYFPVAENSFAKKKNSDSANNSNKDAENDNNAEENAAEEEDLKVDASFLESLNSLKKGATVKVNSFDIKESETSAPKRYTSGTLIIAMEKAGQQIEDNDEFREQLKGSGIGTSATRAGILEKLFKNKYLKVNKKTQVVTPELLGEMIYDVVDNSIKPLLDPKLTASWEKGLTQVADGTTSKEEYRDKLYDYVKRRTELVRGLNNQQFIRSKYYEASKYYKMKSK